MITNLNARHLKGVSADAVFGDIAKANSMSPNQLYQIAVGRSPSGQGGNGFRGGQGGDGGHGAGGGSGRGLGRMTLGQACESMGIDVEAGIQKLEEAGIDARADMAMRDIAEQNGTTPRDVAALLEK
jgi:hypothetical protein